MTFWYAGSGFFFNVIRNKQQSSSINARHACKLLNTADPINIHLDFLNSFILTAFTSLLLPLSSSCRSSGALRNATKRFQRQGFKFITVFPPISSCYPPHSLTSNPACLTITYLLWIASGNCMVRSQNVGFVSSINCLCKFTLIYNGLILLTISLWAFVGVDEIHYVPESTGL